MSFYLNPTTNYSTVYFGEIVKSCYKGVLTYLKLDVRYNKWWTISLTNMFYGENSIHTSAVSYAVVSTG